MNFTELAFPDMQAALDKGNVDAVQVVEPFLTTALKTGGRLVASNYVDTAPNLTIAAYFTSQQTAGSKPDLVTRPGPERSGAPCWRRCAAGRSDW